MEQSGIKYLILGILQDQHILKKTQTVMLDYLQIDLKWVMRL